MHNNEYFGVIPKGDDAEHSGVKGQKWGVRRYQNKDGTYTTEGLMRRRAAYSAKPTASSIKKISENKLTKAATKKYGNPSIDDMRYPGCKEAYAIASGTLNTFDSNFVKRKGTVKEYQQFLTGYPQKYEKDILEMATQSNMATGKTNSTAIKRWEGICSELDSQYAKIGLDNGLRSSENADGTTEWYIPDGIDERSEIHVR